MDPSADRSLTPNASIAPISPKIPADEPTELWKPEMRAGPEAGDGRDEVEDDEAAGAVKLFHFRAKIE